MKVRSWLERESSRGVGPLLALCRPSPNRCVALPYDLRSDRGRRVCCALGGPKVRRLRRLEGTKSYDIEAEGLPQINQPDR